MDQNPLLEVTNLSIAFHGKKVVHDLSYTLSKNEILGIVGESGSGKSVSTLAIMRLFPRGVSTQITGSIIFKDTDILKLPLKELQAIRGQKIAAIFQEPMSSLNPSMTCGKQVAEVLLQHTAYSKTEIKETVLSLFEDVKLPQPERIYKAYPHQISGGQKQRVMIAMAIACKPEILIADEPTTALDITVQKDIVVLLKELQAKTKMSIIFISHDLNLIAEVANRVLIMYQGRIVEQGHLSSVFYSPTHVYTKALLSSKPSLEVRLKQLPTVKDFLENTISHDIVTAEARKAYQDRIYSRPPLLEVINVNKTYLSKAGWFSKTQPFKAVNNVNFKLYEGETLGLVGESGCGKSTLANAILQLDPASSGKILYKGTDLCQLSKHKIRQLRKDIQLIFQDPYASLNPRISIGNAIMEPIRVHQICGSDAEARQLAIDTLYKVGLDADSFSRYPHEFSGGQRQRICIARAIVLQPKLIICDEAVSALDISVQAQILNLLNTLKIKYKFTYIFISHDLTVVKHMSDQLIVMNQGCIEENADADIIYNAPKKEYTQKLIKAIPKGKAFDNFFSL